VIKDIKDQLDQSFGFGTTHETEIKTARIISQAIPVIEKIRFVNSGTEGLMGAIRLARGYTQRDKIVKFTNSYHGHADYLLAKAGSGLATQGISLSEGVPADFIKHTLVIDYGDQEALNNIFKHQGSQIAAVIFEPVGGNCGVVPPDIEFIDSLREITNKYGALLIADEVITGFRFCFGSFLQLIDIKPDLICLGKIIGGGLPIGAYGGNSEIMNKLSPLGEVYQASTFAGNPIVMRARLATLEILNTQKQSYKKSFELTEYLCDSLNRAIDVSGIAGRLTHYGSMFSFKFKDKILFNSFYKAILAEGVYFSPSEQEANFLSFPHTKIDIDKTLSAAAKALKRISLNGARYARTT